MANDDKKLTPSSGAGSEVVVRSQKDLENLSDEELLGTDYKEWLRRRKADAAATLGGGETARERAEEAMKKAETTMKRAKGALDE